MKTKVFTCSAIVEGDVSSTALVSNEPICFYLADPETGVIIEEGHELFGKSVAGTILAAHSGKGSSVVQMDGLYKIAAHNKAPAAVILRYPDPVFVSALLIMKIPSVYNAESAFYDYILSREAPQITVSAGAGTITVKG